MKLTKTVDTLVEDIQSLFEGEPHECNPDRVAEFGQAVAKKVAERLSEARQGGTLRMSNLGKGDRQLWYEIVAKEPGEQLTASTKIKFLYGDILELMLLFLSEEAGHDVQMKQSRVEVDGVQGSMDAVIDGTLVDCKSASKYAFDKFKYDKLRDDDAFGYYEQLAGYAEGVGESGVLGGTPDGAWLAISKEQGHLALLKAPKEELAALNIRDRIAHLKEVTSSDTPPERCYEPVPHGKSGNMALGVNCSYCPFKKKCWADANGGIGLRTFLYSDGPKHFVQIDKEPNVPEITF